MSSANSSIACQKPSARSYRACVRGAAERAGRSDRAHDWHGAARAKIGLQNLAYNIRRLVTLERLAAA